MSRLLAVGCVALSLLPLAAAGRPAGLVRTADGRVVLVEP